MPSAQLRSPEEPSCRRALSRKAPRGACPCILPSGRRTRPWACTRRGKGADHRWRISSCAQKLRDLAFHLVLARHIGKANGLSRKTSQRCGRYLSGLFASCVIISVPAANSVSPSASSTLWQNLNGSPWIRRSSGFLRRFCPVFFRHIPRDCRVRIKKIVLLRKQLRNGPLRALVIAEAAGKLRGDFLRCLGAERCIFRAQPARSYSWKPNRPRPP